MYSTIKGKIIVIITAISGIKSVFGYEKGQLDGYPIAIVVCQGVESTYETTRENTRKYTFKVKVYQELEADGVGAEEAESRMEAMIDNIFVAFENDYTLTGSCYKVDIRGILAYVDAGLKLRVIEATIDCYTLITLT